MPAASRFDHKADAYPSLTRLCYRRRSFQVHATRGVRAQPHLLRRTDSQDRMDHEDVWQRPVKKGLGWGPSVPPSRGENGQCQSGAVLGTDWKSLHRLGRQRCCSCHTSRPFVRGLPGKGSSSAMIARPASRKMETAYPPKPGAFPTPLTQVNEVAAPPRWGGG